MMICKADFEELFPALFRPEPPQAARRLEKTPGAKRSPRKEDAGEKNRASALWVSAGRTRSKPLKKELT